MAGLMGMLEKGRLDIARALEKGMKEFERRR